MSKTISWVIQLSLNEGKSNDFKTLMADMVAATRNEAGCQTYEWFKSADGATFHICERYDDSAATLVHLGNFGAHFAERFMGCVTPTGLNVYGDPSADLRGALDGLGAVYFGPFGGFTK